MKTSWDILMHIGQAHEKVEDYLPEDAKIPVVFKKRPKKEQKTSKPISIQPPSSTQEGKSRLVTVEKENTLILNLKVVEKAEERSETPMGESNCVNCIFCQASIRNEDVGAHQVSTKCKQLRTPTSYLPPLQQEN